MHVVVLAIDGVFDTGLSSVLDVFGTANFLAESIGVRSARFDVSVIGVRRRVHTAQGLSVPVQPPSDRPPDVTIVPALSAKTPAALESALARLDVADAGALLRSWASAKVLMAAACTGTFVVAEAGLLDGHQATTTWWLGPFFRARYPRVALDEAQMLVVSSRRVTAGAALAHVDLALWMVRRGSQHLADITARYLLIDARPAQGPYIMSRQMASTDPLIKRFDGWVRERLAEGFSLAATARGVGTSERTLSRRVRAVLGKSPLSYVQDLRVEEAIHLLKADRLSIDDIANRVGYADGVTLRALLRRRTGRGVRELRSRG